MTLPSTRWIASVVGSGTPPPRLVTGVAGGVDATVPPVDVLAGRVVLVTGAGSGIGRATAQAVAATGGSVVALDRDGGAAAETETLVAEQGGRALAVAADVSREPEVQGAVAAALDAFGALDGVVTSAGIFHGPDLAPLTEVSVETFEQVLGVNLTGTFLVIKHALPLLARRGGSVVTIASTAALRGHGFGAGYTASKGGVAALTRLVAVQGGPQGVRANCICPGGVDTPMTGGVWHTEEMQARLARTVPLGRVADAEDIADVAVFLLSDAARHVTGQTLTVDGGATTT
jgi:NAD(P)-dependent dehydrogenase (short-subunit alcohol dehydrogenase family)